MREGVNLRASDRHKISGQRHARLRGIDTTAAAQVPGVVAVLTHRAIKGSNRVGVPEFDEPVLCDDKARHPGDAVALILAEAQSAIAQALPLIQVDYETLAAVTDPDAALRPESPRVHEKAPGGNVLLSGSMTTGRGAAAVANAVADAIGARIQKGPLTPERVLTALTLAHGV